MATASKRFHSDPFVTCICPTYNRPQVLPEAIECFLRQTYPASRRELIVLDDAGQYAPSACDHLPGVKLHVTEKRFPTLGEKRNAMVDMADPRSSLIFVWDDDDIYLPKHIESLVLCYKAGADFIVPESVYVYNGKWVTKEPRRGLFHASGAFTKELFKAVGGYPSKSFGEDQTLMAKFKQHKAKIAISPECTFMYRWYAYPNAKHLSNYSYESLEVKAIGRIEKIKPHWAQNYLELIKTAKPRG